MFEMEGVDLPTAKEAMDVGGAQAADSHEVRQPRRSTLMAKRRSKECAIRILPKLRKPKKDDLPEQVFRLRFQLSTGQAERSPN